MKSGCKPKKTLRMAVGGAFSNPLQDAYDNQAKAFARVPTPTTPVGGDFGPGRNPRDPSNRPVTAPGGNELTRLDHTMSTHVMPDTLFRPAVEPTPTAPAPQPTLRSATAPSLAPSALEQRLNDRMAAGTLTIRGAGMLQGMEDSRRQADMQRYGIDTQANTSRYGIDTQANTSRYGIDTQANTSRYSTDKQWDSSRYNTDKQWDSSRYNTDKQWDSSRYNTDAQKSIAIMNNDTNLRQIEAGIYNNALNNNTQNSIADKQQQTALANLQNSWNMNQYNTDASVFNNLANSRSRTYGLRNGGEIHAANGFMPGGYAERGGSIKWLSPYDGIKAQASLADMDLKQDALRAQTEALRAGMPSDQRRLNEAFEIQQANNMSRLGEDKARLGVRLTERQLAAQDEDRKMLRTAFDTKLRNDAQDRALAMQDREVALRDAQGQQVRDNIRYAGGLNTAQRAGNAAHNREQDAAAAAWLAKHQAADGQSQALSDQQRREDGLRARADQATYLANEQTKADRLLAANRYQANNAAGQLATLRTNALQDQDRQTEQTRYAQAQAIARAAQQPGMAGSPEDWSGNGYRTHGGADQNAIDNRALMVEGQQAAMQARANQLRDHQAQQSMQLQNDYAAQERAKRDDTYIAQSRADARNHQITGDTYALEDRARNYDMLQQANARLNAARRAPMSFDPRFTQSNGVPRFGLRNGGDMLQTGVGGVVPGKGKGDKIPAKYEPGEFVVSNDMLDAEPGLREHLRGLRTEVLASKGMTDQEADAKAMGGGRGLRADVGWGDEDLNQRRAKDFGLTEEEAADIDAKLQEKQDRGERIRNALDSNSGVAKIAALNQRAAEADARTRADASRGVFRDVDPTMSPELAASREEGRRRDLRSYTDAQSAALDAGKSAPALPKSLRDTGNIYKTVDDQGRVTYSGGNVKAGAKFIGGDGEEFTPVGSVEYAKPGTRFAATPDGKGAVFTPVSEDKNQRAADIAQNAVDIAKWKAKEAAEAPLRAKEQERQDMIGEVRSMEQAAMSGDQRAAAMLPGARNLLADRLKTDALERSESEKNVTHLKGIELQTQGAKDLAAAKKLMDRADEQLIAKALDKAGGNSEATVDLLAKAGRGDLSKILSERVTADNDRRTKDYENMIKEFKGMVRTPDGAEIPGGAELAANELAAMVRAENEERAKAGKPPISNILDADDRAKMMKEATLRARAISGMRAKQTLRDASMIPWAGLKGAPSGLVPSASPERVGFWNGAATGGGVSRGDYEYGDYYLPQDVGQDVIDYLGDVARKKAKGAR